MLKGAGRLDVVQLLPNIPGVRHTDPLHGGVGGAVDVKVMVTDGVVPRAASAGPGPSGSSEEPPPPPT